MTKKVLIVSALVAIIVATTFVSIDLAYAEQLPPGITIDGKSYVGQNRAGLAAQLSALHQLYDQASVTLTLGDQTKTVSFSQIGISTDVDAMVSQAFAIDQSSLPGLRLLQVAEAMAQRRSNVPATVRIDQTAKQKFFDEMLHPTFGARPEDASLNISDAGVAIVPAKDGLWVDDALLMTRLVSAYQQHLATVLVPAQPQKADTPADALSQAKSDAEVLLGKTITLTAGGKKIIPTRSDVAAWILVKPESDGMHARIDPDKLKDYLTKTVAPLVNKKAESAVATKDGTVTSTGSDGATLRVDDSAGLITDALATAEQQPLVQLAMEVKNKLTVVVDPQLGCDPNKAAGKYIEVNLTMQKMCLYEGGNFINTFRVSTGKWSTPTPVGTFAIQNTIDVAYSASFGLYMPHWHAITPDGAYGIHGLPYRGNWVEGVGHIGTPVSHGCIRLGPGDDVFVYGWADIGTPVFIHQ